MSSPLIPLDPTVPGRTAVGIDPSLTGAGIAAIDLADGTLQTAVHSSPAPEDKGIAGHVARHSQLVHGILRQVLACDPALVVMEDFSFTVEGADTSSGRRSYVWWALADGMYRLGIPMVTAVPSQIKVMATNNGNASKGEMVAAYASTWPDAERGPNIEDRADSAWAAVVAGALLRSPHVPVTLTVKRRKTLAKLAPPTLTPRIEAPRPSLIVPAA
ncbi:Uncharacterised protein (plasmid) [Tsukamurella tyrosinosolvens]|uniref:Holliday junction resolvasome RuvABC endonuclease subunit n=1 Tax=Tsukamurella tyrosinosolvens TaxID=57704 RepID=A0A1H4VR19_TSUTY|nr:hypothetical protein [Tsukamurella tyrosinosolvens]KXO90904.1 hypothetical protein AXK58_20950 [Tsukamurella tyrosinosolvens]SEC83572.1 Holliday junction resolvasome RuvABC endonuclease subunit [Tsukamurella tyrosinosolvens]VEH90348.1 Uncharacterised protein [Tsukamurella tyrosinosolvens]